MSDVAHTNAMDARDKLESEINDTQQRLETLRRELKRVEDWLLVWDAFAGVVPVNAPSRVTSAQKQSRKGRSANPPKEEIAEYARELAFDRGAPVPRNAVRAYLENEKGITLEGSDPDMVLSTMLWRMKDRIVRLKGFGYWPREVDYDPAEYRGSTIPDNEAIKCTYENVFDHPTSQADIHAQIAREDEQVP